MSLASCAREPLERACAMVSEGQVVISELRGKQSGTDTLGQWIELFNASSSSISLAGISLTMQKLDGSKAVQIVLRQATLELAAADYFVLGRFAKDNLPAHVQYGFAEEYSGDLYSEGIMELRSCEALVDQLVYHGVPTRGTLSLDGRDDPDAETNDLQESWCLDQEAHDPVDGGAAQLGLAGTPGRKNIICTP